MSRYYMSVSRKFRTLQSRLPGMGKLCKYSTKSRYPGQHGSKTYRKKTFYQVCLVEKQKLRYNYGLTDKKLKFYVKKAKATKGFTSHVLLKIIDRRLDAILFYARLTKSIQSARQVVAHKNVKINRQTISSPSYICSPEDLIMVLLHYILNFTCLHRNSQLKNLLFSIKDTFLFLIILSFYAGFYMIRPTSKSLIVAFIKGKQTKQVRRFKKFFIKIRRPKVDVARVVEFYSRKI